MREIFLFWNRILLCRSYCNVLIYLFGLIVLCNILCLKLCFFLNLICIVLEFVKVFGSIVIVEFIFDGIFIIFFCKFFCFLWGFLISCMKGILGLINFFFNFVMFKFGGFFGNFILFIIVNDGIFFVFKFLWYVW